MPQCSDIRDLTDRAAVCEFAKRYCSLDSIVPYARIVFCMVQSQAVRVQLLGLGILLASGSTGIAAFDYLSPNLTYVAEVSELPQSLMGVTVLAFGNGSVDVFGAFVALQSGKSDMAIGEIMGGAFFVVTVVVGSMAIISPFRLSSSVPKDILVLQLATLYTCLTIRDGVITVYEALFGVLGYVLYCVFVVLSHLRPGREAELPPLPPSEQPRSPCSPSVAVRPSLYTAMDMNWRVRQRLAEIDSDTFVPRAPMCHSPVHPQRGHLRRRSSAPELLAPSSSTSHSSSPHPAGLLMPALLMPALLTVPSAAAPGTHHHHHPPPTPHTRQSDNSRDTRAARASPHDLPKLRIELSPAPETQPTMMHSVRSSSPPRSLTPRMRSFQKQRRDPYSLRSLVRRLLDEHALEAKLASPAPTDAFPTGCAAAADDDDAADNNNNNNNNENDSDPGKEPPTLLMALCPGIARWKEHTWVHRIVMFPMLPVLTLLAWSVPLAGNASSRLHLGIHSLAVPFIVPLLVQSLSYTGWVLLAQTTVAAGGLVWWGVLRRATPPPVCVAAVGFFMGILWVVLLATEFVSILTVLAEVCRVSTSVMGLTVFALGDSLGDFVSNITVAQIGYPEMAVAACFGGPIFTLLMGVSGAGLASMLSKRNARIEIPDQSPVLMASAVAIMATLTLLQVQLVFNNNRIGKKMGLQLIVIWCAYICASVYFF